MSDQIRETIYRNSSTETLTKLAATLVEQGHVALVTITENPVVDGNSYITTSASNRDIMSALRRR